MYIVKYVRSAMADILDTTATNPSSSDVSSPVSPSPLLDSLVIPQTTPVDPISEPATPPSAPPDIPAPVSVSGASGEGNTSDAKPKKRKTGVAIIVSILLLLIALPVGVYYISQKQSLNDIRNRAARSCFDKCREEKGTKYCNEECGTNNVVTPKPEPGEEELIRGVAGKPGCDSAGGFWCGDFCISGKTKTCNQTIIERGGTVVAGVVKCKSDGKGGYVADKDDPVYANATSETLAQVNAQCIAQKMGTGAFLCKEGVKGYSGGACTANNGVAFNGNLGCFCGTVQVDTGTGHQSYTSTCGCDKEKPVTENTPTPTTVHTNTPTRTPTATATPTVTPTVTPTTIYTPTHTPTGTPGNTSTATPTITATPTATPTPQVGCNSACTVNTDCSSGLVCIDSACRNPSCTEKTSCQCDEVFIPPTPQTPVAGSGPSVMGAMVVAGGFFLLLFGLAL